MNDIFISYASGDRKIAHNLADALEALGWSVWWDREIPLGKAFDQVIEEELNAARCVIVLWSRESVLSRWVKSEAAAAADRDCLVPVLIEDVPLPLEFRRIQTAMLPGWAGERDHPDFGLLVNSIKEMLGQPVSPQQGKGEQGTWRTKSFSWKKIALGGSAVIAAFVALMLARTLFHSPDPKPSQPVDDRAGISPQPDTVGRDKTAATTGSSRPSASVTGAFAIRIGDSINEDGPLSGAGVIENPGSKDVYTFIAASGQRVYFRMLEHGRGMEQINWRLTDPDGTVIFDTCLGCGEPGAHTLRKGGTYTLTVGSERAAAVGTYRLRLFDVPAPHQFSINVGDAIKEDAPGVGAGMIETPGAKDVYTLRVASGQRVYFRMLEHGRGMEQINWRLTDSNGTVVFDTCLGCGEPGTQTLRRGGMYTLAVGSDRVPAVGAYQLRLFDVPPPHQFSINVGDVIKEGSPGGGAGVIETPGAKDVYNFSVASGNQVYFRMLEHGRGMEQINWRLTDSDGTVVFDTCLGCGDPGTRTLRKGGTYTLMVGSDRVPAVGAYRLQISNAGASRPG